jgi:hypothetical protein
LPLPFLVEVISAQGAHALGIAIYRLFLPSIYLLLITGASLGKLQLTASIAVLCLGSAWVFTLILIWHISKWVIPGKAKQSYTLNTGKKMA